MAARRWRSTRTARPSGPSSGTSATRRRARSSSAGSLASTPMSAAATGWPWGCRIWRWNGCWTPATTIDRPLLVDPALRASLAPDHRGRQHDELATGRVPWSRGTREEFVASPYVSGEGRPADRVDPRLPRAEGADPRYRAALSAGGPAAAPGLPRRITEARLEPAHLADELPFLVGHRLHREPKRGHQAILASFGLAP